MVSGEDAICHLKWLDFFSLRHFEASKTGKVAKRGMKGGLLGLHALRSEFQAGSFFPPGKKSVGSSAVRRLTKKARDFIYGISLPKNNSA